MDISSTKNTKETENAITMERLHLRESGDTIDVLYRPLHTYIWFVPNNVDGKARIKELALMSKYDFTKELLKVRGIPQLNKENVLNILNSNAEEWYQKSWKQTTQKILTELCVDNPIEEPIWTTELERMRQIENSENEEQEEIETGTIEVENI